MSSIHIKSPDEIGLMRHGGKILSDVLWEVLAQVKPGVSELEIDALAESRIREKGGEPGFKKVKGYHHTLCICTNDVVVHGIPSTYTFQEGDVVCIDGGVYYGGFHTDMAETIIVGKASREVEEFVETGKRALDAAIKVAKVGNRIGHIAKTIQDIVEKEKGYGVVRNLVGHGVGRQLHEEPQIPGFLSGKIEKTLPLRPGMTIAIEVIYTMGKRDVVYKGTDDWTIVTKDGSLSAVFERTVLLSEQGPEVLTP
ncbi:MAG: type I methionyl aminopeptidase [Candidatus Levybacteria bacterium]|nr:type I methionyl aminopeptidase [Candidatus Levybacteria bacterium]